MISIEQIRDFVLSLPETEEASHFDLRSFRVKKKILMTVNAPEKRATIRLSMEMQDIFSAIGKGTVYPVPNKWGHYGWTHIDLDKAEWALCQDAITNAWWEVAPQAIRAKYPNLIQEEE